MNSLFTSQVLDLMKPLKIPYSGYDKCQLQPAKYDIRDKDPEVEKGFLRSLLLGEESLDLPTWEPASLLMGCLLPLDVHIPNAKAVNIRSRRNRTFKIKFWLRIIFLSEFEADKLV